MSARASSDGIGLASVWIGGGAPAGFGSGSFDLDAGVAWIEAYGATAYTLLGGRLGAI